MSRRRAGTVLLGLVSGLVYVFLIAPAAVVIPMSFGSSNVFEFPPRDVGLVQYRKFFRDEAWTGAAVTSLKVAAVTTVVATVVGTMAAWAIVRAPVRPVLRKAIYAGFVLPLAVPLIIMAVAEYGFFARWRLVGTATALVLAHAVIAIPYVVITVTAVLRDFDRSVEYAAMSLGARPATVFRRVTLPLISPAVLSGAFFAFIASFDEIVLALFLSGSSAVTLPVQMYETIQHEISATISAISTLLIALSAIVLGAVAVQQRRVARLLTPAAPEAAADDERSERRAAQWV